MAVRSKTFKEIHLTNVPNFVKLLITNGVNQFQFAPSGEETYTVVWHEKPKEQPTSGETA